MIILLLCIGAGVLFEIFGGIIHFFVVTYNAPFEIYSIVCYIVGAVVGVAGIIDYIVHLCRRCAARRRREESIDFNQYLNKSPKGKTTWQTKPSKGKK